MAKAEITIPLGIPDVRVLQTSLNECGEIIITIESTKTGTPCRKCEKWITKLHGRDEWVTIRHLPAFGRPTYLRYRPSRYQCLDCERHATTTQSLDWHDANSPHSFSYDNHILLQLVNSTVEDVSLKEGLSYESMAGALERRIEASVDWARIAEIKTLGLDEIALKKGQRDYVTLVTGRLCDGEIMILGVLPGHEKAEVIDFLRTIPHRIVQTVESVCCDLWEAYTVLHWMQNVKKSGLHCYDDFLKLLNTWWEEITNYFIQRENSGFVEGFNNKIKILKRRCYGIFNLKHLFQRIYLDLHGYRLFAATTIYTRFTAIPREPS